MVSYGEIRPAVILTPVVLPTCLSLGNRHTVTKGLGFKTGKSAQFSSCSFVSLREFLRKESYSPNRDDNGNRKRGLSPIPDPWLSEESLVSTRCLDTTTDENVATAPCQAWGRLCPRETCPRERGERGVQRANVQRFSKESYLRHRNEDENPGNAKHQLGLFSEESAMSTRCLDTTTDENETH